LYYWLREYGFNYAQISEMAQAIESEATGKIFETTGFTLNVDRGNLIVGPSHKVFEGIELEAHAVEMKLEIESYDVMTLSGVVEFDKDPQNAMLDRDLLAFPLQIRKWEEGDRFMPLGMRKFKKISDFLIDLKVPFIHKKQVKVLCSGTDIVWLIGYRIDNRYKISPTTQKVMYFKKNNHV
jgi:tRNA(Ile)-lysidine synthase